MYPEKTSRSRVENQQTQPTYDAESRNRTWAHIGGRRVLSPLRHPCTPKTFFARFEPRHHNVTLRACLGGHLHAQTTEYCVRVVIVLSSRNKSKAPLERIYFLSRIT